MKILQICAKIAARNNVQIVDKIDGLLHYSEDLRALQ
jgi:hypothetical protein